MTNRKNSNSTGNSYIAQGWVQIHILGSNINTTQPNQIQLYIVFLDFNSNFKIKYKYAAILY